MKNYIVKTVFMSLFLCVAGVASASETQTVRNAAEIDDALELAANNAAKNSDVIDVSCDDSDEDVPFCATDFASTCEDHGGGLSTNPDGSITCSVMQAEVKTTAQFFTVEVADTGDFKRALNLKSRRTDGAALVTTCSPGARKFCTQGGFAKECDNAGGGMSTNPDGSVSCHVP